MATRILVAGLGNIFLGDDGFGSEVARRLAARPWPAGVTIGDFGVRSFDLQCALQAGHDAAILVDVTRQGGPPGTLYWIDPNISAQNSAPVSLDPHGMDPVRTLELAMVIGGGLPRLRVLGCEPACLDEDAFGLPLSAAVARAVPEAVAMVEALITEWLAETDHA
jgi:hydrogenase maturation protease